MDKLSRRSFLCGIAAAAAGAAVIACQPQTVEKEVEKVVKETVVVEKVVKETVVVEKAVKETVVVKEAVPVTFTGQIVRYNTIGDYEAATGIQITEFKQAPMLDALVANKTLPPLKERLPDQPLVLQPAEQIGEFGGSMLSGFDGDPYAMEDLMREFPNIYGSDMVGVFPNVFMGWEVNNDATSFVFKLRPGMKWSDGQPFSADDFVFWYEAVAANTEFSPRGITNLKVKGQMGTVTKVSQDSIKMDFAGPYGVLLELLNRWREVPYLPAHYMKQFHPSYTDKATLDALVKARGYTTWTELFSFEKYWYTNPNLPTIFAWKAVTADTSAAVLEYERNPYYWKIDTTGNQLPYADKQVLQNMGGTEGLVLKALAGEIDYQHQEWFLGAVNYPVLKQNEDRGGYKIYPMGGWCDTIGTTCFNMSIDDQVLRDLFRNKDFRIALSLGFDREAINETIFNGTFIPSQPAPPEDTVYRGGDPAFKQYIKHDPDEANKILDGLGLKWNAAHTQRILSDGRPFELSALALSDGVFPVVQVAELMVQGWKEIGLNVILVPAPGDLMDERVLAGDYELTIAANNFGGKAPIIAALRGEPMPIVNNWEVNPPWGQWLISDGKEGEEPPDDVKRLYEIYAEFVGEPDTQKRIALEKEVYEIHNRNLWIIGAVKAPADLPSSWYAYFSNRMYNIPSPVAPEFYYSVPATWCKRAS
ncbi:MAG: ABC transporter substrate-binding protein [Anaerolineaceae bacterium]|nr:ABC transporter substrate-binding protein [Anaerolineaceae bacterium]